jgi:hypothetical protein
LKEINRKDFLKKGIVIPQLARGKRRIMLAFKFQHNEDLIMEGLRGLFRKEGADFDLFFIAISA